MTTRELPAPPDGERVEDGPVRFGDDWTGTFIRGDSCHGYAMHLQHLIDDYERLVKHKPAPEIPDVFAISTCRGLLYLLQSSNETPTSEEQKMATDLKPCPFCGRGDTVYALPLSFNHECTYVRCSDCSAQGPCKPTRDDAISAWNERAESLTK